MKSFRNNMKGFFVYITPQEYDGYLELCDAANVAGADGLISEESATQIAKFTNKMSNARYKQIKPYGNKKTTIFN